MKRGKTFAPDGSTGGAQPLTRQQRRQQERAARKTATRGDPQSERAPSDPNQRTQIAAAVKQATHHVKSGNYRAGLEIIENILRICPNHAETLALKGNLAYAHGDFDTAIELYRQSALAEPRAPYVLFNLGAALVKALRYAEAIEPLQRAIKLQPDLAQAHNALGGAYLGLWRFSEAYRRVRKALALSGPNAPGYLNLAMTHLGLGEADSALACFVEALRLKGDRMPIYDGIIPAAASLAFSDDPKAQDEWVAVKERLRQADPESRSPEVIDYTLEKLKADPAPEVLTRVQAALPSIDEETIALVPRQAPKPSSSNGHLPQRVCALQHFGRSATGLLHALLDGHPQVTTLPGIYFKGFFGPGVWDRIHHGDPDEMIGRFIDLYEVLFDARHPKPVPGNASRSDKSIGVHEGVTSLGKARDQALELDKRAFQSHLRELLAGWERVTQGDFFLMIHRAFDRAQGKAGDEELVFYHIHNPNDYEVLNFLKYFPDSQFVMNVREPIQNSESWITKDVTEEADYLSLIGKIAHMPFHTNLPIFQNRDAFGIRLDDLKLRPEASMRSLAQRLGIDWNPSLLSPTMQGLEWWGDPGSSSFGLDPFDPGVLERKVGNIFGERDQRLFGTIYHPFRVLYGWETGKDTDVRDLLAEASGLVGEILDCEKLLAENARMPVSRLTSHVSHHYLRQLFRSRLQTLEKYGTYPGMIQPLTVAE